jgi:putative ABC transport system permease protein
VKVSDVIKSAVSNSFRSKLRTTLTVVAIFIGAFTLTITSAIGTGISDYINTQIASIGSTDVLSITKAATDAPAVEDGPAAYDPDKATSSSGFPGGSGAGLPGGVLTEADLGTIRATGGIVDANPVVRVVPSYIEYESNGKFELSVNITAAVTKADLAAGTQLASTSAANEILLPSSYLENLGFADAAQAIGKSVTIGIPDYQRQMHEVQATVVGIQNASLFGGGAALGQHLTDALTEVQKSGRPAGAGESYMAATAHIAPDATQEQIDAIKAGLAVHGYTGQTVADQIGTIQTVINGIIGVLNAFAVIALIAAGFGIINTLLMSVQERTREIGLMKAMGMSGGKIYALFSAEAVFIGFLGSAIGALVAIGVGSLVSNVLADTVLSDLQGLQVLQFAPASVVGIILVVMLIAFLGGTLPARRASRQNPIDALRYE